MAGCSGPINNGETCTAETYDHECVDSGSLTFFCPDNTNQIGLPNISWQEEFVLGEHWGAEGQPMAQLRTWAGPTSRQRRNADLVNMSGGFEIHCRVCGLDRVTEDTDIREGHVEMDLVWGPNMFNSTVREATIAGYSVFLVSGCNRVLGRSLAFVRKIIDSGYEGQDVLTNPCDCPAAMYKAHITTALPPGHEEYKLMVVPVIEVGKPLHIGLTTDPLHDYWTTTTTTSNTSTTTTSSTTNSSTTLSTSTTTASTTTVSTSTSSTSSTTTSSNTSTTTTTSSTTTTTSSSTTTTTTGPLAFLQVVPPIAQVCKQVAFSSTASRSQHERPRPLIFTWHFGSEALLPPQALEVLSPLLAGATADNLDQLIIPSRALVQATASLRQIEVDPPETMPLDITVQVTNFENTSTFASARMQIYLRDLPPRIRPRGSWASTVMHAQSPGEIIEMAVVTEEQLPSCAPVLVEWRFKRRLSIATWQRKEQWSNWASFAGDTAQSPNVIRFAPNALLPDSLQFYEATATFDSSIPWEERPKVRFQLTVGPYPEPTIIIAAPSVASAECPFALDASGSKDTLTGGGGIGGLSFLWSCFPPACKVLPNFAPEQRLLTDGTGSSSPLFAVEGGLLMPGTYQFSLRVGRTSFGGAGSSTWTMQVVSGIGPPAMIYAPWPEGGRLPKDELDLEIRAVIRGEENSGACRLPSGIAWRFALVEALTSPLLIIALLDTVIRASNSTTEMTIVTTDLRGSTLEPGREYAYALLQASHVTNYSNLSLHVPVPLDAGGPVSLAGVTTPFTPDRIPYGGNLSVSPLQGEAARSQFQLRTSMWFDEDQHLLEYAFFYFPMREYLKNVKPQDVFQGFSELDIEWRNTSSPKYWAAMQGRMLQSWSRATSAFVTLPTGSNFLVVLTRDTFGALGTRAIIGPTVTEPFGGLVAEEVDNLLNFAMSSNNFDQVLCAVGTVAATITSGQLAGSSSNTQVANQFFDALSFAVSIMDVDDQTMLRTGQVTASLLGSGLQVGAGVISRAFDVLGSCLDRAASTMPGGLSEVSSQVFFDSLGLVSANLFSRGNTSDEASLLAVQRLVDIASKLGSSLLPGIAAGEVRRLSAPGLLVSVAVLPDEKPYSLEEFSHPARHVATTTATMSTTTITGDYDDIFINDDEDVLNASTTGNNATEVNTTLDDDHGDVFGGSMTQVAGIGINARILSPSSGSALGRRLGFCGSLALVLTEWPSGNPHQWVDKQIGLNGLVADDATVTTVTFLCDSEPTVINVSAEETALQVKFPLTGAPAPAPPSFYNYPVCLMYDPTAHVWTPEGLRIAETLEDATENREVTCLASRGGGSYTLAYLPVADGEEPMVPMGPITLTTTTTPVPTSTTTAQDISLVIPVFVGAIAFVLILGTVLGALEWKFGAVTRSKLFKGRSTKVFNSAEFSAPFSSTTAFPDDYAMDTDDMPMLQDNTAQSWKSPSKNKSALTLREASDAMGADPMPPEADIPAPPKKMPSQPRPPKGPPPFARPNYGDSTPRGPRPRRVKPLSHGAGHPSSELAIPGQPMGHPPMGDPAILSYNPSLAYNPNFKTDLMGELRIF